MALWKRPAAAASSAASDAPVHDVWQVLRELGVDPAKHFATLLLDSDNVDEKRRDEAAKQLLPYCYAKKPTQPVFDPQGQLVGYVLCED